jgi:hypothetical protein
MAFSEKSVNFDGSDDYVSVGNVPALNFERTDTYSISCWVKFTAAADAALVTKQLSGNPEGWGFLVTWSGAKFGIYLVHTWPTNRITVTTVSGSWNDGAWHHVCVTKAAAAAAASFKIYVDGADQTDPVPEADTLVNDIATAAGVEVGRREHATSHIPFSGNIDEVAIYDKELSAGEVLWIWNLGAPRDLAGGGAPSNLIGWWRMGEGDTFPILLDTVTPGTFPTLPDAEGSNDGVIINMEVSDFVLDSPGGSYSTRSLVFGGTDERVNMGDVLDWDRFVARSWSFWYKTTMTSVGYLISKMGTSDPAGWEIAANSNGKLLLDLRKVFITDDIVIESNVAHNTGNWVHVVVTWSGATGTASDAKMYFDGVEDTSLGIVRNALTGSISNSDDFILGDSDENPGSPTLPFVGSLDEVAVYTTVLSAGDVTAIYNGGVPNDLSLLASASGLAAWWRMGEGVVGSYGVMTNMDAGDIEDDAPLPPLTVNTMRTELGGTEFRYKMRGQDDGVPAPGYVTWIATFQDFLGVESGSSSPPIVGTLIPGSVREISKYEVP